MHANLSNHTQTEQPVLVYRHKSDSLLYGAAVLDTLRQVADNTETPLHSEQILEGMNRRFPRGTFSRDPGAPIELFKPKEITSSAYLETLLIPCDSDQTALDERHFRYRGYLINPEQQRFDVLRGDHMEEPTQALYSRLTDQEKQYAIDALSRKDKSYFPCKIEKSYDLSTLPTTAQFLNDLSLLR